MLPAAGVYEALVRSEMLYVPIEPRLENLKMVSSVINLISPEEATLDETYWSGNLVNPVLFNQAVQTACTSGELPNLDTPIEIGHHPALSGPVK
jgi:acyl transferase domain-containing protein